MTKSVLGYAKPEEIPYFKFVKRSMAFRFAIACWAIPLAVGIGDFALWVFLRNDGLEMLGFLTLLLGTAMAAIGALLLLGFVTYHWSRSNRPGKQVLLPAVMLLLLLASNFAAAAAVMRAVDWVETKFPQPHNPQFD